MRRRRSGPGDGCRAGKAPAGTARRPFGRGNAALVAGIPVIAGIRIQAFDDTADDRPLTGGVPQTGLSCAPAMRMTARDPSPVRPSQSRPAPANRRRCRARPRCARCLPWQSAATHGASSSITAWTDVHGQQPVLYLLPSINECGSATHSSALPFSPKWRQACSGPPPSAVPHVDGGTPVTQLASCASCYADTTVDEARGRHR